MPLVDVVVVSYNNRDSIRQCVQELSTQSEVRIFVVDNASFDATPDVIADLDVDTIRLPHNRGFAHGCNAGWRAGASPYVLFLNPDARIEWPSLRELVAVLERTPSVAVAAPRIVNAEGALELSQRHFPRLRSTYAQALFLHRVFPRAEWTDELIGQREVYERSGSPDWVSGACLLIRRSTLEEIGGWDDGFFMYCEDIDLCRRVRDRGYDVTFVPDALVVHEGGRSAPRAALLPVLAESRLRYARKHRGHIGSLLERVGVALGALTHAVAGRGGREARIGHARALVRALSPAGGRGVQSYPFD